MFAAFAGFELNRIRERTKEGIERAKVQGKKLGRPKANNTAIAVQEKRLVDYHKVMWRKS